MNFPHLPYPDYCPDCGQPIPAGESCPCYAGSFGFAALSGSAESKKGE